MLQEFFGHFFTAPKCLLHFFAHTQQGGQILHAADSTRSRIILNLIFTIGLKQVRKSVEIICHGWNRLPFSCNFTQPFQSCLPFPIWKPYFGANRELLPLSSRICDWDSLFLLSESQMATGKLYSLTHECLSSITPEQTFDAKQMKYSRPNKLQSRETSENLSQTRGSFFVFMTQSPVETIRNDNRISW